MSNIYSPDGKFAERTKLDSNRLKGSNKFINNYLLLYGVVEY